MDKVKKVVAWLVVSSENPENVSLALRGLLVSFIPVILNFAPFISNMFGLHFMITSETLTTIVTNVVNIVNLSLVMIGTAMAGYGAIRKLYNSLYDVVKSKA